MKKERGGKWETEGKGMGLTFLKTFRRLSLSAKLYFQGNFAKYSSVSTWEFITTLQDNVLVNSVVNLSFLNIRKL